MRNELIRVSQLPIIDGLDALDALKAYWNKKADDMEALAPTEENKKSIKKDRADARKEYEQHLTAYKIAREEAFAPIRAADDRIAECIKVPFERLDSAAKSSVEAIESAQKDEKETACQEYFQELCAVHGIDFLSWEQLNISIKLSTSLSAYRDQINEKVAAIADGMDRIDREAAPENRDEIMSEYKRLLDVGAAILRVQERKKRVAEEAMAAEERAARKAAESAVVAKVKSAIAPPVEVKEEQLLTVSFKATATREKLLKLREFMKTEGIKYE